MNRKKRWARQSNPFVRLRRQITSGRVSSSLHLISAAHFANVLVHLGSFFNSKRRKFKESHRVIIVGSVCGFVLLGLRHKLDSSPLDSNRTRPHTSRSLLQIHFRPPDTLSLHLLLFVVSYSIVLTRAPLDFPPSPTFSLPSSSASS
jgi:hypothetical protein